MGLFDKKHSIGKTIAKLRSEKSWTQVELAEKLNVSDKAVSKWEKDGSAPSIDLFPMLAELFGVSIDYLMTGKEIEEKIVTMSRAELCAKKDDISMVKEIDAGHKDENGKTFIDHIVQYNSENVFVAFCELNKHYPNISKFDIADAIKFCIVLNRLDLLTNTHFILGRSHRVEFRDALVILDSLAKEEAKFKNDSKSRMSCIITDDILKAIVCDTRINESTLSVLLGNQKGRQCVWYPVFPFLIHKAYINGKKEMLDRLLTLAIESNERGFCQQGNPYAVNRYFDDKIDHGFVCILDETIITAIEKCDFENVERFNQINKDIKERYNRFTPYIVSDYEMKMAKLRADKSVSREKLLEESVIHDGIVNLDELLKVGDIKIAKKVLKEYPIHFLEKPISLFMEKDYKSLFKWAIDNDEHDVARVCADRYNHETNRNIAFSSFIRKYADKTSINDAALRETLRIYPELIGSQQYRMNFGNVGSIEKMFDLFCKCKQFVLKKIEDVKRELQIIDELSSKYFEKQLANDNIEMVVIKLCVRLEAVLKLVCHYEGTFEEMLTRYCNDGKCDENMATLLNKLRKQRNNYVHAEKSYDDLTKTELQLCIDYICNIK